MLQWYSAIFYQIELVGMRTKIQRMNSKITHLEQEKSSDDSECLRQIIEPH